MFASHLTTSNNFIKRSIHNIIYNSLFIRTMACSHPQSHYHSNWNHSKLNTPSHGMRSSSSQGGQLICGALLRARRQKRGLYHSLRLGAVPPNCPSGHPPSSAHPVYPLSVHESHLTLGPSLVPHHTLPSSILCISPAWLSVISSNFLIPSSHLKVTVLVEQSNNLYQDYLSPLHISQFFSSFFLVRFHHLRHALVLCLTSMSMWIKNVSCLFDP